ncbi:hypothetical protein FACS1894188_12510 [Clostridia bacterium]|nr:hypothetical protein FACS1894188_12510 [Clostridia bacterium]
MKTLVTLIGVGLGLWGAVNLMEGYAGVIIGLSPKNPENTGVSPIQSQAAALGLGEIIPITSNIPRLW